MKTLKYTQNVHAYLNFFFSTLILAGLILLLVPSKKAIAQTNDPKLNQQYYIFDHNIDDAWNTNKGSSSTNIAIHSLTGFTTTHEDIVGRFLNPSSEWFQPQEGYASEVAGIIGANSNNGVGMAGIDWYGTMKSYNILRRKQSGDNDPYATFYHNGKDYYLDIGKLDAMVNEAIQDNMDIQLFTFGIPGGKEATIKEYQNVPLSGVNDLIMYPSLSIPDPQNDFWDEAIQLGRSLVEGLYNSLLTNNLKPPSDLELFRQKLWEFTQQPNNGVTLAPAGDVSSPQLFDTSMPAIFDNYVVTVGGAEKDANLNQYVKWSNSREGSFVDVSAAAKDIVSLSGTGSNKYTNNFTSTAAAMSITGGVISLLKAEEPSLTHDDIEEVLKKTARDLEDPGEDDKTGAGFVDAQAALNFVINNDVVHKSVQENDILVTAYEDVSSQTIEMSPEYLNFSSQYPTITGATGKLKKIEGKITFDKQFTQAPEVWLRMTSDGIDTQVFPYDDYHKYDPYDKNFRVISATKNNFTFELYFWKISYYNSGGALVETQYVPDFNNDLTIDFTAVGQETNLAPEPEISISGLNYFNEGTQGNWSADINNGQQPYNITWYRRYSSSGPWSQVGTGSSYDQTVTHEMDLKAKVLDADYQTDEDIMHINVMSGSCSPFPCPQPKIAGQNLPTTFGINQNYPNPFNPSTTIKYELSEQADVRLSIYNVLGRRVATLVNSSQQAGFYEVNFDGQGLASGLYIARLEAVSNSGTQFVRELKMQMIK